MNHPRLLDVSFPVSCTQHGSCILTLEKELWNLQPFINILFVAVTEICVTIPFRGSLVRVQGKEVKWPT